MFENMLLYIKHKHLKKNFKKIKRKKKKNILRPRNKIKIIWFYSENKDTAKETAVLIDFKTLKKHLHMFFDVESEELRYLFCIQGKRKMPDQLLFNNFCNYEWLKRKQRDHPSKRRRKKRKGKVLITSRRFNWR